MPPQLSVVRADRLAELRAQNAVKDRELQTLEAEIAALEKKLSESSAPPSIDGSAAAAGDAADEKKAKKAAALAAMTPLERVIKTRDGYKDVPLDQMGNMVLMLQTVAADEESSIKLLRKTIAELELQSTGAQKKNDALESRLADLVNKAGFSVEAIRSYYASLGPDGSSASAADAATQPPMSDEKEAELTALIKQRERELHLAERLYNRKGGLIAQLDTALVQHKSWADDLSEATNHFRLAELAVREQKETLKQKYREHSALDVEIEDVRKAIDLQSFDSVRKDHAALAIMSAEMVEARRTEDRIIKLQTHRMETLRARLKVIEEALDQHKLRETVEARIPELVSAMEFAAAAEEEAVAGGEGSSAYRAPDSIIAQYCTVDVLEPKEEMLPSSILALFTLEREHRKRNLRRLHTMLHEKGETVGSVATKLDGLVQQLKEADDAAWLQEQSARKEHDAKLRHAQDLLDKHKKAFVAEVQATRGVTRELQTVAAEKKIHTPALAGTPRTQDAGSSSPAAASGSDAAGTTPAAGAAAGGDASGSRRRKASLKPPLPTLFKKRTSVAAGAPPKDREPAPAAAASDATPST